MLENRRALKALDGAIDHIIRRTTRITIEGKQFHTSNSGVVVPFREMKALAATLSSVRTILKNPSLVGSQEDVEEFLYGSFRAFDRVLDQVLCIAERELGRIQSSNGADSREARVDSWKPERIR